MVDHGNGQLRRETFDMAPSLPNCGSTYGVYKINVVPTTTCPVGQQTFPHMQIRDIILRDQQQQQLQQQQQQQQLLQKPFVCHENCAVYDPSAPVGQRFKVYRRKAKKKPGVQNEIDLAVAFTKLKADQEKSPIAKLNEFMSLQNKTVEYELVSLEGLIHDPLFTFRAKCDSTFVYGKGSSKKEAKKNAAIAYLNKIDCNTGNNAITSTTSNHHIAPLDDFRSEEVLTTITELNPVGVLQELCMARRWELPDYKFFKDANCESHKAWYSMECSLKIYVVRGEGKTKQAAKRQAARLMYDKIKNLSPVEISALNYCETDVSSNAMPNNNRNKSSSNDGVESIVSQFSDTLKHLKVFFNQLKSSENPSINKLKELSCVSKSMFNSIEFLENIRLEEDFNVTYILISSKSTDMEVLVQLTINPIVVNIGVGKTYGEAKEAAAYSTLVYLKLLLEQ